MEVFTGWVPVNFQGEEGSGAHIQRDWVRCFLLRQVGVIRPYRAGDLLDSTVTVAPSGVGDVEDEAALAAVDEAFVSLDRQPNLTVAGVPQFCLVLRAHVAALNSTVYAITYQVTILSQINADDLPVVEDRPDLTPEPDENGL
jgi:hypothetical protein